MSLAPTVDLDIDELDTNGDGLARFRGQIVAVPFTLPGERVRARLRPWRGDRGSAILIEVLRPSPARVTPRCPHFGPDAEPGLGPCGGCSWQHIAYPEQLVLKRGLVDRLVRRAVPQAPQTLPMRPGTSAGEPWGYRHKVHFVFGNAPQRGSGRRLGALIMGHYVRGSRRIVPVRECPVHDERGNTAAFMLADFYAGAQIAAAGDNSRGVLRSIAVRVGCRTPEVTATLVVTDDADKRLRTVTRKALEDAAAPTAFHVNLHPEDDGFIFGRDTRRIAGPERMREEIGGTSYLMSPTAFFQTNVGAAEVLVDLVLAATPAGATVLDLYAGAGLFALALARAGHPVTAVEENRAAVADGEASLRLNRIPPARCRFIARPVEDALRTVRPADVVVLDPPRGGCTPEVIAGIFEGLRPAHAVYVSCDPEALAHDLSQIAASGYRITRIQPVDMFPHTAHVETVVTLARRS
jgi:23S rRNA (uracil1939-C5)-methyltransferase